MLGAVTVFVRPFRYRRVDDVASACDLLRAEGDGAKVLAGGQSLLPMLNVGLVQCDVLVDISHVDDMVGVVDNGDGYLDVGALTRHSALVTDPLLRAHQPLLSEAARWVGNPRVRSRGTIGGSLAHADPAAELPLVLTAIGATVTATDGRSSRQVKADELALTHLSTQLGPDEIVTGVRVPVLGEEWTWGFAELSRRRGDFAIVAVAVLLRLADHEVLEARVSAGGVGDRPIRLGAVEVALSGASRRDVSERVGTIGEVRPGSDASASGPYRQHLLGVLVRRTLDDAFARAEGRR